MHGGSCYSRKDMSELYKMHEVWITLLQKSCRLCMYKTSSSSEMRKEKTVVAEKQKVNHMLYDNDDSGGAAYVLDNFHNNRDT